jgi:hypothetical protein
VNRHKVFFAIAILACLAASPATASAQQQVTPPSPIIVNSPIVIINNSLGDQTLPHVSEDLAAYTDVADGRIHYYRFSTGVDSAIPAGTAVGPDTLSDVNGNHICFSRQEATAFEIGIFDTTTSSITEIDPHSNDLRLSCALGGNTLVYVDFGTGNGYGDIFAYDLAANPPVPPQAISLSPNIEQNPNVSPDGSTVVWESCPSPVNPSCDIWKAVRSGGAWTVSNVVSSPFYEENPDTDGTWIAYDTNRGSPTGQDIFYQPVAGGLETNLLVPGTQVNPSLSKEFIGFESTVPPETSPDIFVYDIAHNELYQVTSTHGVNEQLNDVSVLDNGDVRVVWAADDGPLGELNVYGTTFTPASHQISYQICPLYDSNVAKKSGSAYPIKLQLCDSAGNNMSSSGIVVHAVSVTRTSTNTPMELDDTGNANPDFDFRYDSTLDGYVFTLSTKGYSTGTYNLNFTAGADLNTHAAAFAVK